MSAATTSGQLAFALPEPDEQVATAAEEAELERVRAKVQMWERS